MTTTAKVDAAGRHADVSPWPEQGSGTVIFRKIAGSQQLAKGLDPETVQAPVALRQLVVMSAVLEYLGGVDEKNGLTGANTQPQVVVLAGG